MSKIHRKAHTQSRGLLPSNPHPQAIPIPLSKPRLSCPTPFGNALPLRANGFLLWSSNPRPKPTYLQSWGPVPRVRTGVAGTLRPSKLEALLGSERVGLDRDGQARVGVHVRDCSRQQALLPAQAQDPTPSSRGKMGRSSASPGGASHGVPSALQVTIKI